MKQMNKILIVLSLITFSSLASAAITCQTVGSASCQTPEGFCIEFVETQGSSPDMWENMCGGFNGEFQTSGCDQSHLVLTCIKPNNIMMPIMRFSADFGLEEAKMVCGSLGGESCSN